MDQQLCIEGEPADRFFIIVSGQCGVFVASKEENVSPLRVATLHALDFLGENALLRDENKRVRNATVTCEVGVTQVLSLERRPYELLVKGGYISEASAKQVALMGQKREELNQKSLLDAGKELVQKLSKEEKEKEQEENKGGRAVVVQVGPDGARNGGEKERKERKATEPTQRSLGIAPSPPPLGVSILQVEK
jgi:CRP-like cAMP-binding protein